MNEQDLNAEAKVEGEMAENTENTVLGDTENTVLGDTEGSDESTVESTDVDESEHAADMAYAQVSDETPAKYKVTGAIDIVVGGEVQGQYRDSQIVEFPVSVGDSYVAEGRAEKVEEETEA